MTKQDVIVVSVPNFDNDITDIYQLRNEIVQIEQNTEVTIVIVAYNRLDVTQHCIESVLEHTKGIKFKLALVYNETPGNEAILEYFKTVEYENKIILHVNRNIGAAFAYQQVMKYAEGKYIVHLPNDVIVTSNWLDNLIKCAESDIRIGMVNPVSSNVSNFQQVDLNFKNYDEMQTEAAKFNKSDKKKWSERLRLITLATLFRRDCLSVVGNIFDEGFAHNFSDDDITFRVRRAGYKAILAGDTWVHHDHVRDNLSYEEAIKYNDSLAAGRKNFNEKYYGLDAWDDVNNFIPEVLTYIQKPSDNRCNLLGIDVRCGTPLLEIKNKLREYSVFDTECCAVTTEGKYFIDLQTVCGADNVVVCPLAEASSCLPSEAFDYIIIGNNINEYTEPFRIIKNIYSLLKKGGSMFFYLKNTFDIIAFLNIIGYRNVRPEKYAYNISVDYLAEYLKSNGITVQVINAVSYSCLPQEYIKEVNERIGMFVKEEFSETSARLSADKYVLRIIK